MKNPRNWPSLSNTKLRSVVGGAYEAYLPVDGVKNGTNTPTVRK